jgi:AcrR family transcriptional regulator
MVTSTVAAGMRGSARKREANVAVRLDRETIVRAARRVLDDEGLGKLTMRRIGTELGADPTAVYRHFRSKDELVTELADRAFLSVPEPDQALPWQDRLRELTRTVLELYRSNPDFAIQLSHQDDDTPGLRRLAEISLDILADAGLDARDRAVVDQLLVNYVVGSGLFISQLTLDDWGPNTLPATRRAYAALPPDEFPRCVESAPHLFPDLDEVYGLGIDMFIEAIEERARSGNEERA